MKSGVAFTVDTSTPRMQRQHLSAGSLTTVAAQKRQVDVSAAANGVWEAVGSMVMVFLGGRHG